MSYKFPIFNFIPYLCPTIDKEVTHEKLEVMRKSLIKSRFLCALFAGSLAMNLQAQEWKLVWSDEFDVDGKPDEKVWSYEHGFARNNEAQWYQ